MRFLSLRPFRLRGATAAFAVGAIDNRTPSQYPQETHCLPALHPHLFRHAHASILLAAHVDLPSVSQRLGHAKISTTEDFYAHALKVADRRASDAFSRVLQGSIAI